MLSWDDRLFPMWGVPILLALTDFGFLKNDSFIVFRLCIIVATGVSVVLTCSILHDIFGRRGALMGALAGLNPLLLQPIGGLYDQMLYASLCGASLLCLVKAEIATIKVWSWSVLAAVLLGVAGNMRPDLTYVFILFLVLRLRGADRTKRKQIAISMGIFLLLLAPWAIHYHKQSGMVSLAATMTGPLAYISLGLQPNPWGIVHKDGWDKEEVLERLQKEKPGHIPSDVFTDAWANKIYWRMYMEKIRSDPVWYLTFAWKNLSTRIYYSELSWPRYGQFPFIKLQPEDAPTNARLNELFLKSLWYVHYFSLYLLTFFGVRFLLLGMRNPLFDIGGFFLLTMAVLCAFFSYYVRYFFSVGALQGLCIAASVLYVWEWYSTAKRDSVE